MNLLQNIKFFIAILEPKNHPFPNSGESLLNERCLHDEISFCVETFSLGIIMKLD